MKKIALLAVTALMLMSCSKKGSTDEQPKSDPTNVTISGSDYAITKIGTQTWTTVNYNGTGGISTGNTNTAYGKLYTLAEAKAVNLPSGWRLPTKDDAEKLLLYIGAVKDNTQQAGLEVQGNSAVAKKLRSTTDWSYNNGDNSSGFNAYPAGQSLDGTSVDAKGTLAVFWTSTAMPSTGANAQFLFGIYNTKESNNTINDDAGMDYIPNSTIARFSVRFVKDN